MSRFSRRVINCFLGFLVAAGAVGSGSRLAGDHYLGLANRLAAAKRRADAIVALRQALAWDPGRSAIARRLGDVLTEGYDDLPEAAVARQTERSKGLLNQAVAAYVHAIDSEPGDAWSWAGLGGVYARLAACERRSHGIDLEGFSAPALVPLSSAERLALAAFDRALVLEPNNYRYHDERADLLRTVGHRTEAVEAYRKSAEIMPIYHFHAWGPPADLSPDIAKAVREGFEAAISSNQMAPRHEILRTLAYLSTARGDHAAAQSYLERAIAAAPDRRYELILRSELGDAQKQQGKYGEALASFRAAQAEPDVAASARANVGLLLMQKGKNDAAFSELRQAVALRPSDAWLRLTLAKAAAATGRDDLAVESLEAAASLSPRDAGPVQLLLDFYRNRGERGRATEVARRLVEGWPQIASYRKTLEELEGKASGREGDRP